MKRWSKFALGEFGIMLFPRWVKKAGQVTRMWFIVVGVLHAWQMWSVQLSSTWLWVVLQRSILSLVKIVYSLRFFLFDVFHAVGWSLIFLSVLSVLVMRDHLLLYSLAVWRLIHHLWLVCTGYLSACKRLPRLLGWLNYFQKCLCVLLRYYCVFSELLIKNNAKEK